MSAQCLNSFNTFYYTEFTKMMSDAKQKSSKNLMLIYKKVSLSIKKYPFPILSSAQASQLEGVGETIRKLFDNLIKQHKANITHDSIDYIQLAYHINAIKANCKSKKSKQDTSLSQQTNSAMRIAKIKNLVNIPLYSSLWTSTICAYLIYYQMNSGVSIDIDDVMAMSRTLSEQFKSVDIDIEESTMEDFREMKLLDIVDVVEREKRIKINDYLIKLAQIELKKVGIEVEKDEEGEIEFTMSQVNSNNVHNKQMQSQTQLSQCYSQQCSIVESFNLFTNNNNNDIQLSNKANSNSNTNGSSIQWNDNIPLSDLSSKFKSFLSTTTITENHSSNITLLIDNREKGSNNENFKDEILTLSTSPINISERNLSLGDFLWIYTDPSDSIEYVLDLIIERKTLNDLASSIIDGRYTEQKCRLKASGFNHIAYLFEGTVYSNDKAIISKSALSTAINNTMTIHDINAVKTSSTEDTVRYLIQLDSYVKKSCEVLKDNEGNRVTFEEYMRLNAKTKHATVESVFVQQLRSFNNCGCRSVELIRNVFKCPLRLFRVVNRCYKEMGVKREELRNLINVANWVYECKGKGDKEVVIEEEEIMMYFKKENLSSKIKKGIKSVKKIRKDTIAAIIDFYLDYNIEDEDEGEGGDDIEENSELDGIVNDKESNKENINDMILD